MGLVYNINKPWLTLDPWQKEYIETEGNCFVLCGRQSGKTAAASIKFGRRAATIPNKVILMIAFTEKQAYNLFFKTLLYLQAQYPYLLSKGKDKPTQHIIKLKNGSKIMCYAAGQTGMGLVGYTVTDLVIDEAAGMNREIFILLSPTLSVTGGSMDLISTPRGKEGYFYECSMRDDFKKFYVSAENCPRHKKEFLEAEKGRMTKVEYAQEYLAVFLDELRRFFSDDLIKNCCTLERTGKTIGRNYLGVDCAGLGEDQNTFEIIEKIDNEHFIQTESVITEKKLTTETSDKIIELENIYKFRKIGVDDAGTGFGVFSELLRDDKTKRRVIALNNASRPLDKEGKRQKRLLKEDMYHNLKALMEQEKINLLKDDEVIASLKSIQWEKVIKENQPSKDRIFSNYGHVAEGLIRACWLASQDKTLSLWAR